MGVSLLRRQLEPSLLARHVTGRDHPAAPSAQYPQDHEQVPPRARPPVDVVDPLARPTVVGLIFKEELLDLKGHNPVLGDVGLVLLIPLRLPQSHGLGYHHLIPKINPEWTLGCEGGFVFCLSAAIIGIALLDLGASGFGMRKRRAETLWYPSFPFCRLPMRNPLCHHRADFLSAYQRKGVRPGETPDLFKRAWWAGARLRR